MADYAKLDNNNVVINIEVWDSDPGSGYALVGNNLVIEGDIYNSSTQTFSRPDATADENEAEAKRLLSESDWTQLDDVGLTSSNVTEWQTYRASLRTIAKSPTDGNLTWPDQPDKEYA